MIVEYIRYSVGADRGDALLAAYAEAQVSLRASPHCLGYELARCVDAPEVFILRIQWDSAEGHLKGFRSSPAFQSFLKAIQPFVKDIAEMRHYELTAIQWSR